jgi:hypothetical protein
VEGTTMIYNNQLFPFEELPDQTIDRKGQFGFDLPDKTNELEKVYNNVVDADPDRVAKISRLAKKYNSQGNEKYIDNNLENFEKLEQSPSTALFNNLAENYPITAEFLKDSKNMALAKDDIENLSAFESYINNKTNAYHSGQVGQLITDINKNQFWQTLKTGQRNLEGENQKQEYKDLQKEYESQIHEGWFSPLTHAARFVPFVAAMARKGVATGSVAAGPAATIGAIIGGIPLATVLAGAAYTRLGPMGAQWEMFEQVAANTFEEFANIKDNAGNPIDPQLAAYGAMAVSAVDAGMSYLAMGPIIRGIPGGTKFLSLFKGKEEAFKKLTTKEAIKAAVKKYLIHVASGTALMTGMAVTEKLGRRAIIASQETNLESIPMQDSSQNLLGGKVVEGSTEKFKQPSWMNDLGQVFGVIPDAALTMIGIGAFGLIWNSVRGAKVNKSIEATKQAYKEAADLINKMKTGERAPDELEGLVKDIVKDTQFQTVFIPADEWREYWEKQGIELSEVNNKFGIEEQYKTALESGGDVSIPYAEWMAQAKGSPHEMGLADSIKFDPDQPTKKQWAQFQKDNETLFQSTIKQADSLVEKIGKMEEREGKVRAGREAAYNASMEALNKTAVPFEFRGKQILNKNGKPVGKTAQWENIKKKTSQLFAARAVIASEQQGITVEEWVNKILPNYYTSDENPTPEQLGVASAQVKPGQSAPEFYSKLKKTIESKMGNFATPDQIRGILKEIKQEEINYSGLEEFLKDKGKVSKQELLDYLRENQVRVEEVTKESNEPVELTEKRKRLTKLYTERNILEDKYNSEGKAKYKKKLKDIENDIELTNSEIFELENEYVNNKTKYNETTLSTPGGKNYREVLVTLPENADRIEEIPPQETVESLRTELSKVYDKDYSELTDDQKKFIEKAINDSPYIKPTKKLIKGENFQSSHWNEKNVLAHFRINDRIDADGKKVLFVEEIQSDWAKDIREGKAPKMPFLKNWHELALKKILGIAAREGYDKVAWTTGEMQKERYSLEKHVENIWWSPQTEILIAIGKDGSEVVNKRVAKDELPDYIGKDLSEKLLKTATTKEDSPPNGISDFHSLKGLDLKIGAKWTENLYDNMIPQFLGKYTKRFGGKVEEAQIEKSLQFSDFRQRAKSPLLDGGERIVFQYKDSDPSKKYEVYKETNENGETRYTFYIDNSTDGKFSSVEQLNEHLAKVTGLKTQSLELTPALRESILKEGQPLFQGDKSRVAGAINLAGERPEVIFFKATDASTLIHELSHAWIKDHFDFIKSGKASEADLKQWQVMKDWLKITEDQTELTRGKGSQQEQFARGFEAYLREGTAPSKGLEKVFSTFQKWMLKIYKTVKALGPDRVPLNKDVRGFMDRMLATEDEIEMAKFSFDPAGMDAVTAKMSDKAKETIGKYEEVAKNRAFSILFKRQLKELTAKYKAKLKEESSRAREDIANEVENIPFFQTYKQVAEEVGKNVKEIGGRFLKDELTPEEKLKFWMISEAYEYDSPHQMAEAFVKGNSPEQEIDQRLAKHMAQFADLKDSGKIREEAEKSVHNSKSAELIALQEHFMGEKVVKRNYANMTRGMAAMAKVQAIESLSGRPLKDAVRFKIYFTLEKNAADRASAAASRNVFESGFGVYNSEQRLVKKFKTKEEAQTFLENKQDQALMDIKEIKGAKTHKHEQLIAHALATEAIKIDKWRDRAYRYLGDFQKKKRESFKNEKHFNQAGAIALRFGFPHPEYSPLLKDETLKTWVERMDKETDMVVIPEWLHDETIAKDFDGLTVDQAKDVIGSIKNINHIANYEDKLIKLKKGQDLKVMIEELKATAQAAVPEKDRYKYKFGEAKRRENKKWVKNFANEYLIELERMSGICFKLDNYKENGPWTRYLYDRVWEAGNIRSNMMLEMSKGLEELFGKFSKEELNNLRDLKYYPEIELNAAHLDLIAIALNLGNKGNREKLFSKNPLGIGVWKEDAVLSMLEKNLSDKDWDLIEGIWNLIGNLWPESSKLHERLTGFAPEKVIAQPFVIKTKEGKTRAVGGGYFPLKGDSRDVEIAKIEEIKKNPLTFGVDPIWKTGTKKGHLQLRTDAKYPLELEVGRIIFHISEVVQDISFREAAIDIRRILANEDMKNTIVGAIGPEGYDYMVKWLRDTASGNPISTLGLGFMGNLLRLLRGRVTASALFLKPTILIENAANILLYGNATEGYSGKEALNALVKYGALEYLPKMVGLGSNEFKERINKLSPFMRDRSYRPDFLLRESAAEFLGDKNIIDITQEFSTGLLSATDDMTAYPVWWDAYTKKINETGNQKEAIRFADRIIDNSLGSGRVHDVAGILRGNEAMKSISMFYSWMNVQYNRYLKEYRLVRNTETRSSKRFVGYAAGTLLFLTASMILSGKFVHHKSDKKESTIKRWTKETFGYFAGFFPGGRELMTLAIDRSLDLQTYGYRPSPIVDAIASGNYLTSKMIDLIKGKAKSQEALEAGTKAASYALGYPDQLNIWFWNLEKIFIEGMKADLPSDLFKKKPRHK